MHKFFLKTNILIFKLSQAEELAMQAIALTYQNLNLRM